MPQESITIRLAHEADIPELTRQTTDIARSSYSWRQHLGAGESVTSPLALVAESEGRLLGHIGADQGFGETFNVRTGSINGSEPRPDWWKIHTLAVEPLAQREGIGTMLLNAVLDRAPRDLLGLYGSINPDHTPSAPDWYRRKGFRVAKTIVLSKRNPTKHDRGQMQMHVPGEVFFVATKSRLSHHRKAAPTLEQERRYAERDTDTTPRNRMDEKPSRNDIGYRQLGKIAMTRSTTDCGHMVPFGPQRGSIVAWDPELRTVCQGCILDHLDSLISAGIDDDSCDGCGASIGEVSWMVEGLIDVSSALCAACRGAETFPKWNA